MYPLPMYATYNVIPTFFVKVLCIGVNFLILNFSKICHEKVVSSQFRHVTNATYTSIPVAIIYLLFFFFKHSAIHFSNNQFSFSSRGFTAVSSFVSVNGFVYTFSVSLTKIHSIIKFPRINY